MVDISDTVLIVMPFEGLLILIKLQDVFVDLADIEFMFFGTSTNRIFIFFYFKRRYCI